MSALTKERRASVRVLEYDDRPLAAGVKVFQGGVAFAVLSGTNSGYVSDVPSETGVAIGKFAEDVDNTDGSNGSKSARVNFFRTRVVYQLVNDSGTPLVAADREKECYLLDEQTATGAAGTVRGGVVYDVTSEGAWVEIGAKGVSIDSVLRKLEDVEKWSPESSPNLVSYFVAGQGTTTDNVEATISPALGSPAVALSSADYVVQVAAVVTAQQNATNWGTFRASRSFVVHNGVSTAGDVATIDGNVQVGNASAWSIDLAWNDATKAPSVLVTGDTGQTVRWRAAVQITQGIL